MLDFEELPFYRAVLFLYSNKDKCCYFTIQAVCEDLLKLLAHIENLFVIFKKSC